MSRNPSGSKYKISNPSPIPPGGFSGDSPYPSFPPKQPSQSPYISGGPYGPPSTGGSRHNGDVDPRSSGYEGPGGSPARPQRSVRRDFSGGGPPSGMIPPQQAPSSRGNLSVQTQNLRRPSSGGNNQQNPFQGYSMASPISPADDMVSPAGNTLFADPFAADRSHRTEVRAQTSAAARQASNPFPGSTPSGPGGPGNDKLRNVVGAFMSASRQREDSTVARRPRNDQRAQKSVAQPRRDDLLDLSAEGGKFAEIDAVLGKIRRDWPLVLESDFSPSTLALSLLSESHSSSLPRHPPLGTFLKVHESLSTALQSAVQSHFQTFAASLPSHAVFLSTLGNAQKQVKKSREELKEAREGFAGKGKAELAGIRAREQMVRDMLKILDTIDSLKQIPDRLESLIGDKRFLKAALLLVRSIKNINKAELADIGALSDLRAYFTSQETILSDILVDEIQNHLYLKTFYSDSRWRAYIPGQQALPLADFQEADPAVPVTNGSAPPSALTSPAIASPDLNKPEGDAAAGGPGPSTRFSRYLSGLANKPSQDPSLDYQDSDLTNTDPELPSITHRRAGSQSLGQAGSNSSLSALANGTLLDQSNPEADSYSYLEHLLEALAVLGRLGAGLETIAQKVPGEVHAMIEATLDEVEDRNDERRAENEANARPESMSIASNGEVSLSSNTDMAAKRKSLFAPAETTRIAVALDVIGPPRHAAVLRDLFWTLYSKLAAVLEGHRVVYEVARWISSRRDFRDNSLKKANATLAIPVSEIWKPVQHEVRTLLADYLTDEARRVGADKNRLMPINEILRDGKIARDRQKSMFKFSETDTRAVSNETKSMDDAVQQALKTSVPGLVNMQLSSDAGGGQQNVMQGTMANAPDERYSPAGRHRKLIPPNAFNVSTLFQPTLSFIERATSIVPQGYEEETSGFSTVLEDFVVKVFLPQLDERVTASFQQAVSGYDAFQVDRRMANDIAKPPLKSSVRVMALVHSLCVMLQTTPFHKENYSRLIVGVIVQYYQQCSSRFRELASLPSDNPNAADPPLALPAVWAQREDIIKTSTDVRAVLPSDLQENISIAAREVKLEMDLLGNKPIVESQLIRSSRKLEALGNLAESLKWVVDSLLDLQVPAEEPLSPGSEVPPNTIDHIAAPLFDMYDSPKLPLTRAMSQRFEAIVQTYEQLAEMVLNTIRLEIRCRVICNLSASLRKGDFRLESEALEPDTDIVDLNSQLTESEEIAARTLSVEDQFFAFRGLGYLVDHIFISSARAIKMVNTAGVSKIKRNVLTLQQTLRSVSKRADEGVLSRALTYWDLYERGPKEMLESIRVSKPMFGFEDYNTMLNLQCKTDQSEAPSSELNTYLIDLHALSMSIEGWEIGVD